MQAGFSMQRTCWKEDIQCKEGIWNAVQKFYLKNSVLIMDIYTLCNRRAAMLYQASKCILTARIRLCKEKKRYQYSLHEPTIEKKELGLQKMKTHFVQNQLSNVK